MTTYRLWLIASNKEEAITSQIVEFPTKELAEDAHKAVTLADENTGATYHWLEAVRLYLP